MNAFPSDDKYSIEGGSIPPSIGLTLDVLPEVPRPVEAENSQTGVSTDNVLMASEPIAVYPPFVKGDKGVHWYALRATYGQAAKANDYLVEHQIETYYPTIKAFKMVNNKRVEVTQSYLLNILFARGREDELKAYVYDNINLPYLRFYYRYETIGRETRKSPLIVPDIQLDSFRKVCADQTGDLVFVPDDEHKFDKGATVRVIGGTFKGVVGKVARYCGQQRVAVIVDGLLTIATAYVPNAYLERID